MATVIANESSEMVMFRPALATGLKEGGVVGCGLVGVSR